MMIIVKNKICIYLCVVAMCVSFGAAYFVYGFIFEKEIEEQIIARAPDLICATHYGNDVNMVSLYEKLKANLEKQAGSELSIEKTEQLINIYQREVSRRKYCEKFVQ